MAQFSWPYEGQPVNEDEWQAMARLWRSSGVVDEVENELEVTPVAGQLQVRVYPGEAWLDGHYYRNDESTVLDLDDADLGDSRTDLIVVRSDLSEGEARLAVKTGTPGASAPGPTRDHDGSGIWEEPLAEVIVPAAAAAAGGITDRRVFTASPVQIRFVDGQSDRDEVPEFDRRVVWRRDLNRFEAWDPGVEAWTIMRLVVFVDDDTERDAIPEGERTIVWRHDIGRFEGWDPDAEEWLPGDPQHSHDDTYLPLDDTVLSGYSETAETAAVVSGTVTIDLDADTNIFRVEPADDVTIAFSNVPNGDGQVRPFDLVFVDDGYEISWPAGTRFADREPVRFTDGSETWVSCVAWDGAVRVLSSISNVGVE